MFTALDHHARLSAGASVAASSVDVLNDDDISRLGLFMDVVQFRRVPPLLRSRGDVPY